MLLARCRQGDQAAWSELVDLYERLVYSIPRSYGFDSDDAADITQATFMSLVAGLHSLRQDEAIVPWLGTVARRQTFRLIELRRRERQALPREQELDDPEGRAQDVPDTEDPYGDWVQRAWLAQGLAALDPACRQLLTALYLDAGERSYSAVAARIGKAVGTIGPARSRCLHRLRSLMEER